MFQGWRSHVLGVSAALVTAAAAVSLELARPLDLAVHDRLVSFKRMVGPLPYSGPDIAIVGFDEEFLARMPEPFALVHVHLAQALLAIAEAKPRVIAIDLNLPSKTFGFLAYRERPEINFDIELTRALATANDRVPLVLAVEWNTSTKQYDDVLPSYVAASTWAREALEGTTQGRDPRASVTVCPDPDGTVRGFPGSACQSIEGMPAFASRILEAIGQRTVDRGIVNFALGPAVKYVPISAILMAYEARDIARLEQLIGNKIVIIAAILNYSDRLDLPVALSAWEPDATHLPGALFHAQAVRTLAANAMLIPISLSTLLIMTVLLSLLWFCPGLDLKAALMVTTVPAVAAAAWISLSQGVFVPVATLSLVAVVPLLYRLAWDVRKLSHERAFLGTVLRGSVSPRVLAGILSGRLDPARRGGRVHVHVMFADIRGFTKLLTSP